MQRVKIDFLGIYHCWRSDIPLQRKDSNVMARPCAKDPCEPRQVRKEATVAGRFLRRRIPEPPLNFDP